MNLIFLDTETTGLVSSRMIQLAYKQRGHDSIVVEYYKPPVPIEFEAMGVHHITEKMVADCPAFESTATFTTLPTLLSQSVLVAHNAAFDIAILQGEGVPTGRFICTYKVAYRLYDLPNHKLQSLRYRWGIELDDAVAHDAAGDVLVLERVFERMLSDYCDKHSVSEEVAIEEFITISSEPTLIKTMQLGKYRGKTFEEVLLTDRSYLEWMRDKMDNKSPDLIYTLSYYLGR